MKDSLPWLANPDAANIISNGSNSANVWRDCTLNAYLNGTWAEAHPTLADHAVNATIYTRASYTSTDYIESTQKFFLLSQADLFGTQYQTATTDPRDYILGETHKISTITEAMSKYGSSSSDQYYLRSPTAPNGTSQQVGGVNPDGMPCNTYVTSSFNVRPAFFYDLNS